MSASILDHLYRMEEGRDNIITALNLLGMSIVDETKIDSIPAYISSYGVFRGTQAAYEEAYAAGYIPVGTVVIIDETEITETGSSAISYITVKNAIEYDENGTAVESYGYKADAVIINAPTGYKITAVDSLELDSHLLGASLNGVIAEDGKTLTVTLSGTALSASDVTRKVTFTYSLTCVLIEQDFSIKDIPTVDNTSTGTIRGQLDRITVGGRDSVIAALSHIGITVPEGTKIDEIAPYISGYGVFRGTQEAYEEAYAAGNIPVGTVVVIDEIDGTSSILGVGVLGRMILG